MTAPVTTDARTPGQPDPGGAFAMSPLELLRWSWRQLTSMRTALLLLLLVALGSVPGSVIPQSNIAAVQVSQWKELHPELTPIYEKLGLFSVYDSPWFSAIYLLLMVSLVGCIIPRTLVYVRALRTPPPPAPRNLGRLPSYVSVESAEAPEVLLERAATVLRRRATARSTYGPIPGWEQRCDPGLSPSGLDLRCRYQFPGRRSAALLPSRLRWYSRFLASSEPSRAPAMAREAGGAAVPTARWM